MRVLAISAPGDAASQHYRSHLPGLALAGAGVQVTRNDGKSWACHWEDTDRGPEFRGFADGFHLDADVVVLHRAIAPHWPAMVPELQRRGVAVVLDLDDALDQVEPGNVAYHGFHPHWHWTEVPGAGGRWVHDDTKDSRYSWRNVWQVAQLADLVTVSTPALARWARHGRVRVLPNRMPEAYLRRPLPEREPGPPVVGWTGRLATHPGDLQATRGGVAVAVARAGARVRLVGEKDAERARLALGLPEPPELNPWVPIGEYPDQLARLDVGIVPLARNRFNEAKSALKLLELAALGVPAVASPTADNLRVAADGIGVIASTRAAWVGKVRRWLEDSDARACASVQFRDRVSRHTVERHADAWQDAWQDALDHRAAARAGRSA